MLSGIHYYKAKGSNSFGCKVSSFRLLFKFAEPDEVHNQGFEFQAKQKGTLENLYVYGLPNLGFQPKTLNLKPETLNPKPLSLRTQKLSNGHGSQYGHRFCTIGRSFISLLILIHQEQPGSSKAKAGLR